MGDLSARFAATAYRRPFRRYQQLALDAFERQRAQGQRCAYLVLPPGAGKTVLGLEIARRLGQRALVLCPNTAVQAQWLRQWQDFTPPAAAATASTDLTSPITALTYQSLCTFDAEAAGLEEQALALWQERYLQETSVSPEEAESRLQTLAATGNVHYRAELARFRRRARALITRGGARADLLALLHPNGRRVVERMKAGGPWTLILDECHHLLATWGYLVRALIDEAGAETFVVGLTATPPADMEAREAALYRELFGHADFEVATPAVVKEGDLAPYQELVHLALPLEHELQFVEDQERRFQELTVRLTGADFGTMPFLEWLRRRVTERRANSGGVVGWGRFERDHPALAQAALRLFHQLGLPAPDGARFHERHRQSMVADDWVILIEDYCQGYLKASADPCDAAAWEEIRRALPSLGYVLTRQGIRSHRSPVDRVLALSAAKGGAALSILAEERRALGDRLRALVLCDYERAGREVLAKLRGVLDPQAGSAALLLHILLADRAVAQLNPILMTGQTVACGRASAVDLCAWMEQTVPELRGMMATAPLFTPAAGKRLRWEDVVVLRPESAWWRPRNYVPLLMRYFEAGHARCLVGTRGLLGEGWDATGVNVLIDLTAAGTSTAVHQMRGRSLRLDPAWPRKVASNWDVVCVAPGHPKGAADYARFVRKHRHYYAPNLDGAIESSVSHVHPALSPYGPPDVDAFAQINREMFGRVHARETAYERWRVGQPYDNQEVHTIRIRAGRSLGIPNRRVFRHRGARPRAGARLIGPLLLGLAGGWLTLGLAGGPAGLLLAVLTGAALASGAGTLALRPLVQSVRRLGAGDSLEDFAAAVADGLSAAGAIRSHLSAEHVRVVVQPDGSYRCYLAGATLKESQRFADSLDELLAPLAAPRYIIPRYVAEPPATAWAAVGLLARQLIRQRAGSRVVYHAVPSVLATNRRRAVAFARAWHRHVSPGRPLYIQDPRAQAVLEIQRGADPFEVTTQMRTLWE